VKLTDLRKLAIRRQVRIRFELRNGMECVISEHGVAQVPALKSTPDFNLEEELASASRFLLDPVEPARKKPAAASKGAAVSTAVSREELAGMAAGGPATESPAHDDD
jgi:hypothetical protein